MKTIKTTIAFLALSIFSMSCSKDEPTPVKPISAEASFENTAEVDIIDATNSNSTPVVVTPKSTESIINVTVNGTILDLKKLVLEMNIQHNRPSDLSFIIIAPDGTESLFIKRVGGEGQYVSSNKLRFGAAFINTLSNDNIILLPGNYKESQGKGASATPVLLPIFSTLKDKSVTGIWKLKATDHNESRFGTIKSWKLIFEAGALNQ